MPKINGMNLKNTELRIFFVLMVNAENKLNNAKDTTK